MSFRYRYVQTPNSLQTLTHAARPGRGREVGVRCCPRAHVRAASVLAKNSLVKIPEFDASLVRKTDPIHHHHHPEGVVYRSFCRNSNIYVASYKTNCAKLYVNVNTG